MRIGIDATCLPSSLAGAGRYIHGIVRGLGRVDHDNEYFVFIKENDATQFSNLPANVQLVCLPQLARPLRVLWQHALAGVQARTLGLDVWHGTHYALPNFTNGTARVATFHDLGVFHHPQLYPLEKRLYFRRIIQKAFQRARHIVAVSEATTRNLNELLAAQHPHGRSAAPSISTILSGVEEKFFARVSPEEITSVRRQYGLLQPYILFVGTLEKRKNLGMLVRAFHEFCQRGHHDHVLALAGQAGNGSAEVAAAIAELHLQERVRLLGYVSEAHLPALYQGADLFVMPSLYEGFGFPLLEAMAGGVVALASNNSSLRELAVHPQMLCEETPAAWAAKMERLVFDKTLRYELARYGVHRAKDFSWQGATEKLREIYESASPGKLIHSRKGTTPARAPLVRNPLRAAWLKSKTLRHFFGARWKRLRARTAQSSPEALNPTPQDLASAAPAPLSLAEALKKTLAYADLFDYPLTPQELHYGLIEYAATYAEVRHELEHLCDAGEIVQREGHFCFPGREACVDTRSRRRQLSEQMLARHNRVLRLIKNFPFIRGVALSGALAFQNAEVDGDLDLFVIVAPGRLWSAYLGLVLLLKALGKRREVCLNCLLDGAHLAISERDFFVAHQIAFLQPLAGAEQLREFFRANAWCAKFLPQTEPADRITTAVWAEDAARSRKPWRNALEAILRRPLFDAIERLIFKLYRRRIHTLTRHLQPQAITAEPGRIKLFTNDHRFHLQRRLERRLQELRECQSPVLEEEQNEYATF